jgi:hypothetical protein
VLTYHGKQGSFPLLAASSYLPWSWIHGKQKNRTEEIARQDPDAGSSALVDFLGLSF